MSSTQRKPMHEPSSGEDGDIAGIYDESLEEDSDGDEEYLIGLMRVHADGRLEVIVSDPERAAFLASSRHCWLTFATITDCASFDAVAGFGSPEVELRIAKMLSGKCATSAPREDPVKPGSIQTTGGYLPATTISVAPSTAHPAAEPDDAQGAAPVEPASEPAARQPKDWAWVARGVAKLSELCEREAELTSHSRNTLKWSSLAERLGKLHRTLSSNLPPIELGRLRTPPLTGEEQAHEAAAKLVNETIEAITDVASTAAAGGQKTPRSILELCGKIALGLIATLGAMTACLMVPAAGPYLAAVAGVVGAGAIGAITLAHREHNQHAAEFAEGRSIPVAARQRAGGIAGRHHIRVMRPGLQ